MPASCPVTGREHLSARRSAEGKLRDPRDTFARTTKGSCGSGERWFSVTTVNWQIELQRICGEAYTLRCLKDERRRMLALVCATAETTFPNFEL